MPARRIRIPRRAFLAGLCSVLLCVAALGGRADAQQTPRRVPNDPLFSASQSYLTSVHAPEAWATQTGDPTVIVAVLDSGIEVDHPDLAGNLWTNPAPNNGCRDDLHGCSFVDPGRVGNCPVVPPAGTGDVSPTGPHGTFVAGILGAVSDNHEGIAGVAWHVQVMAVRVVDCHGTTNAQALINGIHYAVDHGARILVLSAGSSRYTIAGCRPPAQILADAVQYARDRGVLVVAPSGDDNRACVADPAAAPGVLAVGGMQTTDGGRWVTPRGGQGSNWGPEIAVVAPANAITSTVPPAFGATGPPQRYATSTSTAYASAIVSGEAALLLSQNSLLTPDWLTQLITASAHPLPDRLTPDWAGAGLVDLAGALALVPAGFSGSVSIDGAPAPDGTLVEAYVGDTLCAQAATFSQDGRAVYALFVPAGRMTPGCGSPQATVQLRVEGEAVASLPWSPTASFVDLDRGSGEPPEPSPGVPEP